jgi:hypothetical protein
MFLLRNARFTDSVRIHQISEGSGSAKILNSIYHRYKTYIKYYFIIFKNKIKKLKGLLVLFILN